MGLHQEKCGDALRWIGIDTDLGRKNTVRERLKLLWIFREWRQQTDCRIFKQCKQVSIFIQRDQE